jgi:hypothetical protein
MEKLRRATQALNALIHLGNSHMLLGEVQLEHEAIASDYELLTRFELP